MKEIEKSFYLLADWFEKNKRSFPWREETTPYAVWVSEVMLQQTRAEVVVEYFLRWMEAFPNIRGLAEAPIEKVIKVWEGLGYYSRARNLHEGAKLIVKEYEGKIPSSTAHLQKIKGIGPYTLGAICSFAFKQRAPAVDGNVLRVLSRYLLSERDISKASTRKYIEEWLTEYLPHSSPWVAMEALIELGALVCSKKPLCQKCPLKTSCKAFLSGKAEELPFKSSKITYIKKKRHVGVIIHRERLLLRKGDKGAVMADLYEFPFIELEDALGEKEALEDAYGLLLQEEYSLQKQQHTFTRYRVELFPKVYSLKEKLSKSSHEDLQWIALEEIDALPFSSGHKKVWKEAKASIALLR